MIIKATEKMFASILSSTEEQFPNNCFAKQVALRICGQELKLARLDNSDLCVAFPSVFELQKKVLFPAKEEVEASASEEEEEEEDDDDDDDDEETCSDDVKSGYVEGDDDDGNATKSPYSFVNINLADFCVATPRSSLGSTLSSLSSQPSTALSVTSVAPVLRHSPQAFSTPLNVAAAAAVVVAETGNGDNDDGDNDGTPAYDGFTPLPLCMSLTKSDNDDDSIKRDRFIPSAQLDSAADSRRLKKSSSIRSATESPITVIEDGFKNVKVSDV